MRTYSSTIIDKDNCPLGAIAASTRVKIGFALTSMKWKQAMLTQKIYSLVTLCRGSFSLSDTNLTVKWRERDNKRRQSLKRMFMPI